MRRRVCDALALNIAAAIGFHTLTLACRYLEAKRQVGQAGLNVMHIQAVLAEHFAR